MIITILLIFTIIFGTYLYVNDTNKAIEELFVTIVSLSDRSELIKANIAYDELTKRFFVYNQKYMVEQTLHILKQRNKELKIIYSPHERIKFK